MFGWLFRILINWLTEEKPNTEFPLCDYQRVRYELRPCDVLLIEGRSRISEVIKQITQSVWTHSCLYIGRLHDIDDNELRAKILQHYQGPADCQLVIEGVFGKGTVVSPLEVYQQEHIRVCRPKSISRNDAQQVIAVAISQLGLDYDVRQIIDLARFIFPWSFLPRRWRSSLFEQRIGESTKTVCSTMIADAFSAINFPILPVIKTNQSADNLQNNIELFVRNPRLITPKDFDYSPYFEIIKYPYIAFAESPYRALPWNREGLISYDGSLPVADQVALATKDTTISIDTPEALEQQASKHKALLVRAFFSTLALRINSFLNLRPKKAKKTKNK